MGSRSETEDQALLWVEAIKLVFSIVRDMVIVSNADGEVVATNPITAKILGYDPTGMPLRRLAANLKLRRPNGTTVANHASPIDRALRGLTALNREYLISDQHGNERLALVCAVPLTVRGKVAGSVIIGRDKTDQYATLKRVKLKRAALQSIIDNNSEGIIVVDVAGRITMANPTARRLCLRPVINGSPIKNCADIQFFHPGGKALPPEELPLYRSVFRGETITDVELMILNPDGSHHYVSVDASPTRNAQGKINGAVGIFRDISKFKKYRGEFQAVTENLRQLVNARSKELQQTIQALEMEIAERRQIEEELIQSKKKLQRLSRHILDTLENDRQKMAKELHDGIGASLSAIKFILEERQADIENNESCRHLSLAPVIQHLTNTIKETKSISARLRPSTLDDLGLHSTLSWYSREFTSFNKGIRIENQFDVAEERIPEDYKIVIYRIVQEAVSNATKHANPSLIRSTLTEENGQLHLTVQDNGTGFEPQSALASSDPLRGFGLQNMRQRTELCGGKFRIDSQIGLGTWVNVWLPLGHGISEKTD